MTDRRDSSKTKQIKVLLGVLGAGLITGLLFALGLLYYYNPSGSYVAKNVLLDPENAYSLRFVEPGPKAKSEGKYVFEGVNFTFFNLQTKIPKTVSIKQEQYKEFYSLIANDKSIVTPSLEIQSLFSSHQQAVLALKVRSVSEDVSKGIELTFSEIDFLTEADYYRVHLRQSGPGSEWIYFYHLGIYQKALNIFIHEPGA